MDFDTALYGFMNMVREDPRIGPSHISLFLAILHSCKSQDYQMPVSVYSRDLMKQAKISAGGTYHRCMRDLKEAGYIHYIPSYNPVLGSLIYLLKSEV
jgi:hypothetical protein